MRFIPLITICLVCCSGPASPTLFSSAPSCPAGEASGEIGPGETAEAFAFELSTGDRVRVRFKTDHPAELVAGLAGPYLVKDKATFPAQTVNEYPSESLGPDGSAVTAPPEIALMVHQDGRYAVVVSSTAEQGRLSWSACAVVERDTGQGGD